MVVYLVSEQHSVVQTFGFSAAIISYELQHIEAALEPPVTIGSEDSEADHKRELEGIHESHGDRIVTELT